MLATTRGWEVPAGTENAVPLTHRLSRREQLRAVLAEPMTRTSAGIAASTLLSAGLGVGFWALAARLFSAREVGRDSALVAALLAIAGIGQLNLNNVFPRFLPQLLNRKGRYVTVGYAWAAAVSFVLGVAFVVIGPDVSPGLRFVRAAPAVTIALPFAVAAWAIFSLQDAVLTGLGKASWLPIENGLFSVARILLLPVILAMGWAHAMFLAYIAPMFAAVAIVNWFIAHRAIADAERIGTSARHLGVSLRAMMGYLTKDFLGTVAAQATMAAVPMLVLSMLGARRNAYFYVPFTLAITFDSLFLSVAGSLTTEGARAPEHARALTKRALLWIVRLQLPLVVLVIVAAPIILIPYGSQYVHHGTTLLRVLMLASCFRSVAFVYGAVARLGGRVGRLLLVQIACAGLVIGGVAVLARPLGLSGIGLGWLGAWIVLAGLTAPELRRFLRAGVLWGSTADHGRLEAPTVAGSRPAAKAETADAIAPQAGEPLETGGKEAPSRGRSCRIPLSVLTLVVVAALLELVVTGSARACILFIAAMVAPGTVVTYQLRLVHERHVASFAAVAVTVSLAIEIGIALFMVWTGLWYPGVFGGLLAVACATACVAQIAGKLRERGGLLPLLREPVKAMRAAHGGRGVLYPLQRLTARPFGISKPTVGALVLLVAAIAVWAASLSSLTLYRLGSYGLPPALSSPWYAALAIVLIGSVVLIWGQRFNGWVVAAYLVATAVILFATVPAVSDVPQYAWSYKHIGVASYVQVHGATLPGHDIYQRWPGFFAVAAWLSSITGASIASFATWNELFFTLLDMGLVFALTTQVSSDRRVWATATLLFLITNWVGQNYFSPQCMAYALDLLLLFVVFGRSLGGETTAPAVARAFAAILRNKVSAEALPQSSVWTPGTVVLAVFVNVVMVATHQLTPYILVAQLVALALLGAVRPWYMAGIAGILAVGYLLPNLSFVQSHYGLISGLNPIDNAQVTVGLAEHRAAIAAHIGGVLSYTAALLAAVSFVRLLVVERTVTRTLAIGAGLVAPFIILFGSNYGGEASLRIFMFSSPWRDILIAMGFATLRKRPRLAVGALGALAITAIFLYAAFDSEATNVYPRSEVQASSYFYAHAPAHSELMLAGKDFPTWLGARYAAMAGELGDASPALLDQPAFKHHVPEPADLRTIVGVLAGASPRPFLVFSTTESLYARDFGPGSEAQLRRLEDAVRRSPRFHVWLQNRDTRIYEMVAS
jgi:hypothetical protein